MLGNKGPGIRFLYVDSEKLIPGSCWYKKQGKVWRSHFLCLTLQSSNGI